MVTDVNVVVHRSLDSPSNSLEMVTGVASRVPEPVGGLEGAWDSDMEAEPDPPDWTRAVSDTELKQLTSREKKRQEVINGELNLKKFI